MENHENTIIITKTDQELLNGKIVNLLVHARAAGNQKIIDGLIDLQKSVTGMTVDLSQINRTVTCRKVR